MSAILDQRPSLSFLACCEHLSFRLAYGICDAKELGFDHMRPFQPYRELCPNKLKSIPTLSHPPLGETLMHPLDMFSDLRFAFRQLLKNPASPPWPWRRSAKVDPMEALRYE